MRSIQVSKKVFSILNNGNKQKALIHSIIPGKLYGELYAIEKFLNNLTTDSIMLEVTTRGGESVTLNITSIWAPHWADSIVITCSTVEVTKC